MTTAAHADFDRADFVRLATASPGPRQIVLVSGVDVPLFRLDLPAGLRGQAREQVARRQLTDGLGLHGDQVDMRPFAPGDRTDQWTRVLIADPQNLSEWRSLACRAVIPDYLSLPCTDDVWSVGSDALPEGDIIMVRLGVQDGFSVVPPVLVPMLEKALAETGKPRALFLVAPVPQVEEWARVHDIPLARSAQDLIALELPTPGVLPHDELSCDLRQDPMAARARLAAKILPWRWPLLAAGLAAGLFAATQIVATQRIQADTTQITQKTQALVKQHFVTSGPVLDARVQVSRVLAQMRGAAQGQGGQADPVQLSWRVAEVVSATGAIPETMGYLAGDGVSLALRLPDFASADRLAEGLQQAGMKVELLDSRASTDSDGVRAEFRILPQEARL